MTKKKEPALKPKFKLEQNVYVINWYQSIGGFSGSQEKIRGYYISNQNDKPQIRYVMFSIPGVEKNYAEKDVYVSEKEAKSAYLRRKMREIANEMDLLVQSLNELERK